MATLATQVPDDQAWLRALLERTDSGWTLRYGHAVIGGQPATWPGGSWVYEAVAFLAATVAVRPLIECFSAETAGQLRLVDFDVALPRAQAMAQTQHRPSFELHDRDRVPLPSFEYTLSRDGGVTTSNTAGRHDFLVGPDSPSSTDLDSAYRAFFLGSYEVPANASVPTDLLHVRVLDDRAWLGPIHTTATEMTVEVRGTDLEGTSLEYFSPKRRDRVAIDAAGVVTIALPEGLAASNTWLWLTHGTAWCDYRALTPPWASDEQLVAAGVEKEQTSRDEQAAVEAVVYGGEGPFVEFKATLPRVGAQKTDRAFNTIAAFANGAGGTVVFGVDRDEFTVLGLGEDVDVSKERDRIGQLIRTRVLPTPEFAIIAYVVAGKTILFVQVSAGAAPPYGVITDLDHRDKPQFYVRRGASTYPAQPSDLNELFRRVASEQAPARQFWYGR